MFKKANVWVTLHHWLIMAEKQRIHVTDIQAEINYVKAHLQTPEYDQPLVLCHNDLNHGNVVYDKETGQVHFVDFEFAGQNVR